MKPFTTCLWFDGQAEQAADFYCSIFDDAKVGEIVRYGEGGMGEPGAAMTVTFEANGQKFIGLNGGPQFPFTEAVSFQIHCADQAEVDRYWTALTADGGQEVQCGWLKDRFGLSWQVVPDALFDLMTSPDKAKVERVNAAMMQMVKLDIAKLEAAAAG